MSICLKSSFAIRKIECTLLSGIHSNTLTVRFDINKCTHYADARTAIERVALHCFEARIDSALESHVFSALSSAHTALGIAPTDRKITMCK